MSWFFVRLMFVPAVCTLLLCGSAAAQDSHYWSENYGTRSELLGGAVVGSPQDLSTTFYNPGGLTCLETQSFLLSAKAFEYQWLKVEDATGNFEDLSTDRFGLAPSLFAGTFPRDWVPGTLAYSVLMRQRSEFRIDGWAGGTVPDSTGESTVANMLIDARATETWGGVTWAGDVGNVGFGATLYGALRNQRGRFEILYQPVPTGTPGFALTAVDDYSYWHTRLLAKAGAYWERDRLSLGITLTTPGLPLFGDGEAAYYRSLISIDSTGVPEFTEGGVPGEISVTYRSPTSIAIGGRYGKRGNAAYVTIEWFDSVDPYQVLDTPSAPESGLGSSLSARLTHEAKSVINFAIGYEYTPRNRLTFFGSFQANFASAVDDPASAHSVSSWDIYHFTGGTAFSIASVDFTLGGSLAFGDGEIARPIDFAGPPIFEPSQVHYRKLKAFVGFEFGN